MRWLWTGTENRSEIKKKSPDAKSDLECRHPRSFDRSIGLVNFSILTFYSSSWQCKYSSHGPLHPSRALEARPRATLPRIDRSCASHMGQDILFAPGVVHSPTNHSRDPTASDSRPSLSSPHRNSRQRPLALRSDLHLVLARQPRRLQSHPPR